MNVIYAYMLTFACSLMMTSVVAQAQEPKALERCVQTENDLARLLCYDQLFKHTEISDTRDELAPSTVLIPSTPSTPLRSDEKRIDTQVSHVTSAISSAELDAQQASLADLENHSLVGSSHSGMSQQHLIDNFGAESLANVQNIPSLDKIESVVEIISENNRNIRTFTLANGQVWRETESSRLKLKEGMLIYIEKGALSAHFLGKEESKRRVRVKRVK